MLPPIERPLTVGQVAQLLSVCRATVSKWAATRLLPHVRIINADGTGFAAVDTSSDSSWNGLPVDDAALYYAHGGAIMRRLK